MLVALLFSFSSAENIQEEEEEKKIRRKFIYRQTQETEPDKTNEARLM